MTFLCRELREPDRLRELERLNVVFELLSPRKATLSWERLSANEDVCRRPHVDGGPLGGFTNLERKDGGGGGAQWEKP